MKTVKIPTCWTAEQADSIYRFIQAIQDNIWQTYNEELQSHYRQKQGISLKSEAADEPNGSGLSTNVIVRLWFGNAATSQWGKTATGGANPESGIAVGGAQRVDSFTGRFD